MYMVMSSTPDPLKLIALVFVEFFWMRGTLSCTLISILPNSHFGKRLGARTMTLLGSHVGFHNIQK